MYPILAVENNFFKWIVFSYRDLDISARVTQWVTHNLEYLMTCGGLNHQPEGVHSSNNKLSPAVSHTIFYVSSGEQK